MELCEVLARGSDCDSADNFLAPRLAFLAWIHSEFMFRVWVSGFQGLVGGTLECSVLRILDRFATSRYEKFLQRG